MELEWVNNIHPIGCDSFVIQHFATINCQVDSTIQEEMV